MLSTDDDSIDSQNRKTGDATGKILNERHRAMCSSRVTPALLVSALYGNGWGLFSTFSLPA